MEIVLCKMDHEKKKIHTVVSVFKRQLYLRHGTFLQNFLHDEL